MDKNASGFNKIGQPGFGEGFVAGALIGVGIRALLGHAITKEIWLEIKFKI